MVIKNLTITCFDDRYVGYNTNVTYVSKIVTKKGQPSHIIRYIKTKNGEIYYQDEETPDVFRNKKGRRAIVNFLPILKKEVDELIIKGIKNG